MVTRPEIAWHREQITRNRAVLEEIQAGNQDTARVWNAGGDRSRPSGRSLPVGADRRCVREGESGGAVDPQEPAWAGRPGSSLLLPKSTGSSFQSLPRTLLCLGIDGRRVCMRDGVGRLRGTQNVGGTQ